MIYRRLIQYVKPYWRRLLLAFICMIIFSIFNTSIAWVMRYVFQKAFLNPSSKALILVPIIIILTFLFRGLADFGQSYYMNWVGLKAIADLRNALYTKYHQLSLNFYSQQKTGALISHITYDVSLIQNAISVALADMIKEPLCLIGLVATLFYFDPTLAIISLIVFPAVIFPLKRFGHKVRKASQKAQRDIGKLTSLIQESLSGIKIVKAFSMESYELDRFSKENTRYFKSMMEGVRASQMNRPVIEVLGACGVGLVFWYGATHLKLDVFLSFITALFLCFDPIKKLSKVNTYIQQANAAGSHIFEILDQKSQITEIDQPKEMNELKQGIRFEHLWFRYDSEWILKDINFELKTNEITALVGPSGVGKTTIANLLPRFYDPQKGQLLFDQIAINELSLKSLRGMIGLVTQDVILFNDTVKQNLVYGRNDLSDELIVDAAKLAHADEFIKELPQGYDTLVGERGMKLSGGQCQRLAIARALLKDPKILILDEATSALDSESERLVQDALLNLMQNRTVLVIAHRLSTVRNAQQILVMNQCQIEQRGTHSELLATGGLYKKLYEVQFDL